VSTPIRVGLSACLLGYEVRWNGGHKRDPYIVDTLGRWFTWVPVCPEEEIGLGTPREPLRLEGDPKAPRLVFRDTGGDLTDRMRAYAATRAARLERLDLSGYILKSDSPSCGMERVPVYGAGAQAVKRGTGLFAAALRRRLPLLPIEEEGRLHDPGLRENFIERVFAYRRLADLLDARASARRLIEFHTRHKFQLLAHSPTDYRALGRIAAESRSAPTDRRARYATLFMAALAVRATPKKHANVLQHILGHLKERLDGEDKRELLAAIDDCRCERAPLAVPIALLKHHLRRLGVPYVRDQVYLDPHPHELLLRRHA